MLNKNNIYMVLTSYFNLQKRSTIITTCMLMASTIASAQDQSPKTKMPASLFGFTQPAPMDFNDHVGYVSLFNGKDLENWDGNPKFWRVEDGAIVGESTPANPSGNSYIAYKGMEAKDFTLKFEIKVEGDGGSGMQYRSKTGVPWL